MRKTSHDGGDSTSITSGVENEIKKSAMKPKKSSLKRKAPSFSQESDDTVNEPLLQRDKEKPEAQSAKYFGKGKTESLQNKESDNKAKTTPATTGFCGTTESLLSFKDSETNKTTSSIVAPLHNYMNTNVFNTHDNAKVNLTTKSQILVEIDASKQNVYNPSPLIFTTAKIHTDGKTKQMEPVHVTPVPILSTIEVSVSKGGSVTTNEKKIANGSSVISPVYTPIPLSKSKEDKVSIINFTTVLSPASSKDVFAKAIPVPSAYKGANDNVTLQTSLITTTLPSTTSTLSPMISKITDKQGDLKDIKKEPALPPNTQPQIKPYNMDTTKNNVTVKTITPGKGIDISTSSVKMGQADLSQTQKIDAGLDNKLGKTSSSSKDLVEISNTGKNIIHAVGNKQLQRQKTTTEEISGAESKVKPNIEHLNDTSAKKPSSSQPTTDSVTIKDKDTLPKTSANDFKNIDKTSSLIYSTTVTPVIPISSTTKPTSSNISSKLATANSSLNTMKTVSTADALSNVNKTTTNTIVTPTSTVATKLPAANITKPSAIPTTISAVKNTDAPAVTPQTSISKILPEITPVVKTSTVKPASVIKSKTASVITATPSSAVTTATSMSGSQLSTNSLNKTVVTKTPSATTSAKASSVNSVTSTATKPSSSSTQVSSSGLVSSVKQPAIASSIPKTSTIVSSVTSESQHITTDGSAHKQAISTVGLSASTKTPSTVSTAKQQAVSSTASVATGIKSPNSSSSQKLGASKPSTAAIPKTEPATMLSKTAIGSSSSSANTVSSVKSTQGTLPATATTKEPLVSLKKPALTKTQTTITKSSPVSNASKPVGSSTTKSPLAEVSAAPIPATKKAGTAVLAKTTAIPSTIKTSSASTTTKASGITSSSSSGSSKPTTANTSQVNINKSTGVARSSVPSFAPVPKPSDSNKNSGSKSNENNDGKGSKA